MAAIDTPPADQARPSDELLPFLSNFHDIFTTIGVVILFAGLALGAGQVFQAVQPGEGTLAFDGLWIGLAAGVALAAWLVSAVLVGRQRRILPGIVLSLVFAGCAGGVLAYLYTRLTFGVVDADAIGAVFEQIFAGSEPTRAAVQAALSEIPPAVRVWPVGLGLIFSAVVALYYFSFRLPFSGGLFGFALVWTAWAMFAVADPYTAVVFNPLVNLIMGLALFLAGVAFDARDPERTTRLSGTGFWLHFFAAPTLLSAAVAIANTGISLSEADFTDGGGGMFGALAAGDSDAAIRSAAVTLGVIILFALISLLINRRALIVSGLITAGVAMAVLVGQLGLGGGAVAAVTLLLLGAFVVLLGAAWNPVRSALLAPFPDEGPLARVFPPARAGDEG
ncbi:MAG: hypothetical protein RKE49_05100 [Oceanicaulis sp.]